MRKKFRGFAEEGKNIHDDPFDEEPIEDENDPPFSEAQPEDCSLPDEKPENAPKGTEKMGWLGRGNRSCFFE